MTLAEFRDAISAYMAIRGRWRFSSVMRERNDDLARARPDDAGLLRKLTPHLPFHLLIGADSESYDASVFSIAEDRTLEGSVVSTTRAREFATLSYSGQTGDLTLATTDGLGEDAWRTFVGSVPSDLSFLLDRGSLLGSPPLSDAGRVMDQLFAAMEDVIEARTPKRQAALMLKAWIEEREVFSSGGRLFHNLKLLTLQNSLYPYGKGYWGYVDSASISIEAETFRNASWSFSFHVVKEVDLDLRPDVSTDYVGTATEAELEENAAPPAPIVLPPGPAFIPGISDVFDPTGGGGVAIFTTEGFEDFATEFEPPPILSVASVLAAVGSADPIPVDVGVGNASAVGPIDGDSVTFLIELDVPAADLSIENITLVGVGTLAAEDVFGGGTAWTIVVRNVGPGVVGVRLENVAGLEGETMAGRVYESAVSVAPPRPKPLQIVRQTVSAGGPDFEFFDEHATTNVDDCLPIEVSGPIPLRFVVYFNQNVPRDVFGSFETIINVNGIGRPATIEGDRIVIQVDDAEPGEYVASFEFASVGGEFVDRSMCVILEEVT